MIEYNNGNVTLTCDKCRNTQTEQEGPHNEAFFKSGWVLCPRAKKYIHRCYSCLSKKERKANDFVQTLSI
jgi:hypothetical protein